MKLSKEHYRANGTGRPTKKERREIDDFISDDDSFIGNEE
jgi:ribosome-associated heat shock protein Hsp15